MNTQVNFIQSILCPELLLVSVRSLLDDTIKTIFIRVNSGLLSFRGGGQDVHVFISDFLSSPNKMCFPVIMKNDFIRKKIVK